MTFIFSDEYEPNEIASSEYSYESDDHPELDLFTTTNSVYSDIRQNPFSVAGSLSILAHSEFDTETVRTAKTSRGSDEKEIINDDSGDEEFDDDASDLDSFDPTCIVISTSVKAHAGVSKYKDFIRLLPVHVSKMVLGMLDQVSLFNCVCVDKCWRILAEEVHREYFVNQNLWEEVMLMQVSIKRFTDNHFLFILRLIVSRTAAAHILLQINNKIIMN